MVNSSAGIELACRYGSFERGGMVEMLATLRTWTERFSCCRISDSRAIQLVSWIESNKMQRATEKADDASIRKGGVSELLICQSNSWSLVSNATQTLSLRAAVKTHVAKTFMLFLSEK